MKRHRNCDGHSRRDFLRVGALSATSITLASYLRMAAAGDIASSKAQAAIFVNLPGGPSHIDTFDLKEHAPTEIRGQFASIASNVPGIRICEHLPKLAQCADRFTILRGVSHTVADHRLGAEYINTGSRPLASLEFPGYGAVVTKEMSVEADLPPFVAIPKGQQRAGFLGIRPYLPRHRTAGTGVGGPRSLSRKSFRHDH